MTSTHPKSKSLQCHFKCILRVCYKLNITKSSQGLGPLIEEGYRNWSTSLPPSPAPACPWQPHPRHIHQQRGCKHRPANCPPDCSGLLTHTHTHTKVLSKAGVQIFSKQWLWNRQLAREAFGATLVVPDRESRATFPHLAAGATTLQLPQRKVTRGQKSERTSEATTRCFGHWR